MEKFGFIYIWYDRKRKMFYLGRHFGTYDDGYVCSSKWMKTAYKRRPRDFKRRILVTNISTREETALIEYAWLQLIKNEELKKRYYNIYKTYRGSISREAATLTTREKISEIQKGKFKEDAKGIWFDKSRNKWAAEIRITLPGLGNSRKFMKRFNTLKEAESAVILMRKYRERVVENPEKIVVLENEIKRNIERGVNTGRKRPDVQLRYEKLAKGFYITPWGKFYSAIIAKKEAPMKIKPHVERIKKRCFNSDKTISRAVFVHASHDPFLIEGKTYAEIGYGYEKTRLTPHLN